jgi:hypothetical protein
MTAAQNRLELAQRLGVRPGQKNEVKIAHDPTGDLTGRFSSVYQLGYDLAFGVFEAGTVFENGKHRARWDGRKLRR